MSGDSNVRGSSIDGVVAVGIDSVVSTLGEIHSSSYGMLYDVLDAVGSEY